MLITFVNNVFIDHHRQVFHSIKSALFQSNVCVNYKIWIFNFTFQIWTMKLVMQSLLVIIALMFLNWILALVLVCMSNSKSMLSKFINQSSVPVNLHHNVNDLFQFDDTNTISNFPFNSRDIQKSHWSEYPVSEAYFILHKHTDYNLIADSCHSTGAFSKKEFQFNFFHIPKSLWVLAETVQNKKQTLNYYK